MKSTENRYRVTIPSLLFLKMYRCRYRRYFFGKVSVPTSPLLLKYRVPSSAYGLSSRSNQRIKTAAKKITKTIFTARCQYWSYNIKFFIDSKIFIVTVFDRGSFQARSGSKCHVHGTAESNKCKWLLV